MIDVDRAEVEAVKAAVMSLNYRGISMQDVLSRSIELLLEFDSTVGNEKECLLAALARLQAYLELGFCYDDNEKVFDQLLLLLHTCKQEQFPCISYSAPKIPLTKSRVDGLIERWSCSKYRTVSRPELVDDIIYKVKNKIFGKYEYHSNADPRKKGVDYVYVLSVGELESSLYDVRRKKHYIFIEA